MGLIERTKNICLTPKTEWPVIEPEATDAKTLYTSYIMVLAAIPAVASLLSMSVIGSFFGRIGLGFAATAAIVGYVMSLVMVFVIAFIADVLAPSFDGQKNMSQALKLTAYSMTAAWLAGIFNIIPVLGWLFSLLGSLYSLYLFYLGSSVMMKVPEQKSLGYTVVIVIVAIVAGFIISGINGMVIGMGRMGALGGLMGSRAMHESRSTPDVKFDKDSPMGKLEAFGKTMEESGKKMEAAQKSGDEKAQMAAAMEGLGTLLGGGKRVDPVGIEQLKPFVPDSFAGLPKTSSKAEKSGIAGLMVSKAEASYGDSSGKNITLDVSDTGGASGLLGLAGWIGVQGEKEDQYGSEKTQKVNGRLMHEKVSKGGGGNEFAVVLGDRFIVSATGNVDLAALKAAVSGLDLGKLESMKDVGVQK
jgi:Yip1 domain